MLWQDVVFWPGINASDLKSKSGCLKDDKNKSRFSYYGNALF